MKMKFFRSLAAPALLVSFLTANVPVVMADEKAKIVESAKGLASSKRTENTEPVGE